MLALRLLSPPTRARASGTRRPRPGARGRRRSSSRSSWRPTRDDRSAPRCCSSCRPGVVVVDGGNPVASGVERARPADADVPAPACRALGRLLARRTDRSAPATRSASSLRQHAGSTRTSSVKVYPRPEALRHLLRPAETQLYSRRRALAAQGRGHRVRRPAPVRVRRPRAPDQLAGERAPRRAVGERAAPGAEHRRRPLPRQLRRGAARQRARRSTSPCARRRRSPRGTSERRDRVGLVCFGGYAPLARARAAASAQLYRIVDALLDTEITLSYAWKAIDVVPARTLPPQALVVALTPAARRALGRARCSTCARAASTSRSSSCRRCAFVDPGPDGDRRGSPTGSGAPARGAARRGSTPPGVPVVEWRDGEPLAAPIEEVTAFRRTPRSRAPDPRARRRRRRGGARGLRGGRRPTRLGGLLALIGGRGRRRARRRARACGSRRWSRPRSGCSARSTRRCSRCAADTRRQCALPSTAPASWSWPSSPSGRSSSVRGTPEPGLVRAADRRSLAGLRARRRSSSGRSSSRPPPTPLDGGVGARGGRRRRRGRAPRRCSAGWPSARDEASPSSARCRSTRSTAARRGSAAARSTRPARCAPSALRR